MRHQPRSTLFPYTTLFRSRSRSTPPKPAWVKVRAPRIIGPPSSARAASCSRSEEHTSELQSQSNLVCRLLLEKKKTDNWLEPLDQIWFKSDERSERVTRIV